jgi:fused signal recognition particle receptor
MLRESLSRTRQVFVGKLAAVFGASELTVDTWDDVEALLIQADLGVDTALDVTSALRRKVTSDGLTTHTQLNAALKETLLDMIPEPPPLALDEPRQLTVVLVVGTNGSGKTTTIAKLARRFSDQGRRPILAAADTFRAAAIDQLKVWGERVDIPVIAGQPGGDPGAVTYDAIRAARARGHDLLFVDTAGRLHTKYNLMEELKKVRQVAAKNVHEAPHEVWLVLDGVTGQNALQQARHFKADVGVTGVIVTKLDSSARGGMIFSIMRDLELPVRYIGIGEGLDDLIPFSAPDFVDALID